MSLFIPFILTASLNNHRSKTFHFTTRVTFLFVIVVVLLLSSCTRLPNPLQSTELHEETSDALEQIANPPVITPREIDLYMAIALAVKNNRDLRVKIMEAALANQQVDLVRFGMLPKLAANAGYEQTDKYSPSTSVTVQEGKQQRSVIVQPTLPQRRKKSRKPILALPGTLLILVSPISGPGRMPTVI